MTEQNQAENQGDSVAEPKKKSRTSLTEKWGSKVIDHGYCMIPSMLLRAQQRLHLGPSQLAVLLQIIDHWWDAHRKPYPSKQELASRLGISERQVQRYITDLEREGLLKREERYGDHGGRLTNMYDLQGLVERLAAIEPDFRQAREEGRKKKKQAASPGWRPKKKPKPDSGAPD